MTETLGTVAPPPLDSGEIDDRYRLYVSAMQRARRWILSTTAGEYQTWLLSMNRIIPKEHFEARVQSMASDRLEQFDRDLREAA